MSQVKTNNVSDRDCANEQPEATFFVSTEGSDEWSGRVASANEARTDGPFATLARARDAVREARAGSSPQEAVTVMVRGGKYYLDQTLILGPQDGGTREAPVIYMAYPGEAPILSGGVRVTDWKPYRDNILQCELPGAKGGKWKFRQLFLNGQRQIRARYPKFDRDNPLYGGWAFMEGPADDGTNPAANYEPYGFGDLKDRTLDGGTANAFRYKPGTFKHHWSKPSEGEVYCFPGPSWSNDIIPIKSVDEDQCVIALTRDIWQFDRAPWYRRLAPIANNRFYVENIREELTEPGEWCLDSEEGMLYFWPPTDSLDDEEVAVPARQDLISIRGASWITISGFTFTETRGGDDLQRGGLDGYGAMFPHQGWQYCGEALHLRRAEHCRIENNQFHGLGGNAIYLEGENLRNVIQYNEICDVGANSICVAGSMLQHPMFTQILDNDIHHCGIIHKWGAGVFMGVSEGTLVSHNAIHDMPHHAINLATNGLGRNIIEYNDIRRTCLETHDTGAINSWMDKPSLGIVKEAERTGHVIRYNFIADTLGCGVDENGNVITGTEGTKGIYLDDCTSNCFVYGNIIVRVSHAVQIHLAKNNWLENNIAVDCGSLVLYADTVSMRSGNAPLADFMTGNRTCRNIMCTSRPGAVIFAMHKWSERQIEMSDQNLFYNSTGEQYQISGPALPEPLSLAQWQEMGYDVHSLVADPMFVDPEHDDYRLAPESPAFDLGFQPIDADQIGIRRKDS